ncbi:outer membrane protein assembly factor BamB family protein [Mesobaculum littorinae]|nr:PQQ-binding-like beta-propeller repeat protein [Mesobaculum littorinae]
MRGKTASRGLAALCGVLALAGCEQEFMLPGERQDLRDMPSQSAVVDTTPDAAQPISLPPATRNATWTQKAGGPTHDMGHPALSSAPQLIWSARIGEGDGRRHRITADPVTDGARIYTVDSRARVMAHDTSGRAVWSADLTRPGDNSGDASGAGLAVADGTLYAATAFGQVVALVAATGRRLWVQEIEAAAAGSPTVAGGKVYVVARDARVWALDPADGRVDWTLAGTPSQAGVVGGAGPAVAPGMAVVPFSSAEMVGVLPESGLERWTGNVAGRRLGEVYARISDISGDPVISGTTVYAGSPSGRTAAFDLDSGDMLWSAREGAMSPVAVAGGSVFAVTDKAQLVRLDAATGQRIWGADLPIEPPERRFLPRRRDAVYAHYGPILAGGRLWVASSDGALRGFDPASGALVAQADLPGGATTNAAVANGTLYVVSADGTLLAFR